MNTAHQSSDFFKCTPCPPTYTQIMEMVKKAESQLEQKLHEKRDRLRIQLANEEQRYYHEIDEKYKVQRDSEINEQRKHLERLRMECDLDRQKYIKIRQLQQQIQNSQEFRSKLSQKLIEECTESRYQQMNEKMQLQSLIRAAEKAIIEENRLQQQNELQKEQEAEQIRQRKEWEARQELDKQIALKRETESMRRHQEIVERKLQQQTDEAIKKSNENVEKAKQYEIQRQNEFLRYQIEERRKMENFQRQQEIESAKAEHERIQRDEKLQAYAVAKAKRVENVEISQFNDYMHRLRLDRENTQRDQTDWTQVRRAYDQLEINAELERQKKRQLLNAQQHTEYLQKLNEKRAERLREKEMESYQLQKTQKENAMYEEMMAEKRLQHQSKFIQDLEQQIKLKNMEKARNLESELQQTVKIEEINRATDALNEKLLQNDDDFEKLLPEHPFHHSLKSWFK